MTKLLAGVASLGLLAALSLLSPAAATERPDGIRSDQAGTVDLSAHRRIYRRRVVVIRRYVRPRVRYVYTDPYYYDYYPSYYYAAPSPVFSIGFGFGGSRWGGHRWRW